MSEASSIIINYSLLVFLLSVTAINGVTELNQKCSDIMGLVLGLLVGIALVKS